MKILIYRYNSICEPDIIEAFQLLGHQIFEISTEMTNKSLLPSECVHILSEFLLDQPCDLVFSINFFPAVSEVCKIFKIPYVGLVVDSPVLELFTNSISNDCNRIFVFDREIYNEIEPLNPGHVFHLPLAANTRQKDLLIQSASEDTLSKFSSDVSFVGSLYTEKNPYSHISGLPEEIHGFLDGIMNAQMLVYGYNFLEEVLTDQMVTSIMEHCPGIALSMPPEHLTDRQLLAQWFLAYEISARERKQMLTALSQHFSVDLYTGSDTSELPLIHNRGFAKTLTEMPIIFHQTKININITAKNIRSGIPQRVWDVLSSRGFLISNYQSEIPEFLTPGQDLVLYSSQEELISLIQYYLNHPKERQAIADHGYETVKNAHTYLHRVSQILNMI